MGKNTGQVKKKGYEELLRDAQYFNEEMNRYMKRSERAEELNERLLSIIESVVSGPSTSSVSMEEKVFNEKLKLIRASDDWHSSKRNRLDDLLKEIEAKKKGV